MQMPETPATDAALAAIRAQGVEKFAAQQEQLAADYRKLSPAVTEKHHLLKMH